MEAPAIKGIKMEASGNNQLILGQWENVDFYKWPDNLGKVREVYIIVND